MVGFVLPVSGHPDILILGHSRDIASVKWSPDDPDEGITAAVILVTVEEGKTTQFNDAKCDPRGRIWAGQYYMSHTHDLGKSVLYGPYTRFGQVSIIWTILRIWAGKYNIGHTQDLGR